MGLGGGGGGGGCIFAFLSLSGDNATPFHFFKAFSVIKINVCSNYKSMFVVIFAESNSINFLNSFFYLHSCCFITYIIQFLNPA